MWCEACDWNLEGVAKPGVSVAKSRSERRAQRRAERLHQQMMGDPADRRRHSAAGWMTFLVAVIVHLPAIAFLFAVGTILKFAGLNLVSLLQAAVLVALAILMRPRLGHVPKGWPVLTRSGAPTLFELMDQISAALRARPVHWVVFDLDYNCGTTIVGVGRRRLIRVGLPLWVVLSPPERIALFAHEVASDTNGDLAHSLVVGSALQILDSLSRWLSPPSRFSRGGAGTMIGFAEELAVLIMSGLSAAAYGCFRLLLHYARRASPRAEYLADEEAGRIASPQAAVSCLDKLCLARPMLFGLTLAAKRGESDIWQSLLITSQAFAPREHERLRRIGRRSRQRTNDTHPPTALRIEVLRRLPESPPRVVVSSGQVEAIGREMQDVQHRLGALVAAAYE